jgi:hypothetical protein
MACSMVMRFPPDYWFVVTRSNGKEYRGHFSLKRYSENSLLFNSKHNNANYKPKVNDKKSN